MPAHAQRMSSLLALDKEVAPCRVAGRAYGAERGAVGNRGARSVQGRARLQIWGRAWGGAHIEHVAHVCDAGGVEAQRLVEHLRALPSRKVGMRCGVEVCGSGDERAVRGGCSHRMQARARLH